MDVYRDRRRVSRRFVTATAVVAANLATAVVFDTMGPVARGLSVSVAAVAALGAVLSGIQLLDRRPCVHVTRDGLTVIGLVRKIRLLWSEVDDITEIETFDSPGKGTGERFFVVGRGHRVPIVDKPAGSTMGDLRQAIVSERGRAT